MIDKGGLVVPEYATVEEFSEKVIKVNRVAKVVKGGRRFSFSALVAVGNMNGKVGVGFGKANEVSIAIQKAVNSAKKNMFDIPIINGTIPHEVNVRYGAGHVFMKPASHGTGVIAGGAVRAIMELAGIKDILTKSLGSANALNIVNATIKGLKSLRTGKQVLDIRMPEKELETQEKES